MRENHDMHKAHVELSTEMQNSNLLELLREVPVKKITLYIFTYLPILVNSLSSQDKTHHNHDLLLFVEAINDLYRRSTSRQ